MLYSSPVPVVSLGVLIPSKVAGNPSNRVKSPSNSETSKWERSQQLVPSKGAGKLVLVLGAKWERLGVKILVVPSKAAGNQLGTTWEQKSRGSQQGCWEPTGRWKIWKQMFSFEIYSFGPPQARNF